MYKLHDLTGLDVITVGATRPPLGPGFKADDLDRMVRLVAMATTANDPQDYVEFTGYDAAGAVVATARIGGY